MTPLICTTLLALRKALSIPLNLPVRHLSFNDRRQIMAATQMSRRCFAGRTLWFVATNGQIVCYAPSMKNRLKLDSRDVNVAWELVSFDFHIDWFAQAIQTGLQYE